MIIERAEESASALMITRSDPVSPGHTSPLGAGTGQAIGYLGWARLRYSVLNCKPGGLHAGARRGPSVDALTRARAGSLRVSPSPGPPWRRGR